MLTPDLIIAFLTLTLLEIILGIDNIVFISILAGRFPEEVRVKLMRIGLLSAMVMRILLLFGINWLIQLQSTLFSINTSFFSSNISVQALILLTGGLFLLYKSTKEIFNKVEEVHEKEFVKLNSSTAFSNAVFQIVLIDIVFSFDSILTALGMTSGIPYSLIIMIAAVVVSISIMISFAAPISRFINKRPSLQILGLAFLLLIGFMLITEAASISETVLFNSNIVRIPKGYLYFSIVFSLGVELLNIRSRKLK
tara:strand:+ start:1279 stop:2037 length:759 start_codon:yes stop_codon:yes gene_type:complete